MVLTSPAERQYRSASTQCVSSSIKLPLCQILLRFPPLFPQYEKGKENLAPKSHLAERDHKKKTMFIFICLTGDRSDDANV